MDVSEVGEIREGVHADTPVFEIAELDMNPDIAGGLWLNPRTLETEYKHFKPEGHRTQLHRWQIVTLERPDGSFKKYIRDLGLSSKFPPNSEFLWVIANEKCAGELLLEAEAYRADGWKRGFEIIGNYDADQKVTLGERFLEEQEVKKQFRKRNRVTASRN